MCISSASGADTFHGSPPLLDPPLAETLTQYSLDRLAQVFIQMAGKWIAAPNAAVACANVLPAHTTRPYILM